MIFMNFVKKTRQWSNKSINISNLGRKKNRLFDFLSDTVHLTFDNQLVYFIDGFKGSPSENQF